MKLDIPTLMAAGVLMTAASSVLLAIMWLADRQSRTLLWWSIANTAIAIGIAVLLINNGAQPTATLPLGNVLLDIGPALIWTATREFRGKRPRYLVIVAALAAFFSVTLLPPFSANPLLSIAVNLGISAGFFGAAAISLVRRPPLRLRAVWPLVGFLLVHAAVFAVGAVEAVAKLFPTGGPVPLYDWFGVIHFEQLVFALASSIFVVALVREKSEQSHKIASRIDVLTGVSTRRHFFERASAAMRLAEEHDAPFSLVIFDLDWFKLINDTFGHTTGDRVLQLFSEIAVARLRPTDIIGRLGGEEFAVAMPGYGPEAAYVVADRIRQAFAGAGFRANNQTVETKVSGGVAAATPLSSLDNLIERADGALYRAKTLGRDRIEMASRPDKPSETHVVIRVA